MIAPPSEWTEALPEELAFWDGQFATGGGEFATAFAHRQDADFPIEDWLVEHLAAPEKAHILDVGAGPMTFLGKTFRGHRLNLIACDPLAHEYAELAKRHGVWRPIQTIKAYAEALTSVFSPGTFDLVHASNSLDHSFNPLEGIRQMIEVTRPGGRVILRHETNEAERTQYYGLHKWNFENRGGRAVLWNPDQTYDLTEMFGIRMLPHNWPRNWLSMAIDKRT